MSFGHSLLTFVLNNLFLKFFCILMIGISNNTVNKNPIKYEIIILLIVINVNSIGEVSTAVRRVPTNSQMTQTCVKYTE